MHSVGAITRNDISAHARVVVDYDADVTNPILIRDQLGKSGLVVTLAAEKSE